MPQIQVKWFKLSGKYYTSGLVEVNDTHIWEPEFKQAIVDNQTALVDSWTEHDTDWYVMTDSTPEQDADPNFHGFYTHIFFPGAFKGMKKSV